MERSRAPVSVLIPCYQCSDLIGRAVDSIAKQTHRPAEVIAVDDASGDATLKTLRELQAIYGQDWLKVLPLEKNSGQSEARNQAWALAAQPYIAFLDADDSWHPRKIELQYAWMRDHPEAALTGHPYLCVKAGAPIAPLPARWRARRVGAVEQLLSNRFSPISIMLRRDLPFRFDPSRRYSEDFLLCAQILLSGRPAYRLEAPLAYVHKASYGHSGLSGDLWISLKGELASYRRLWEDRAISSPAYGLLLPFIMLKFVRRLAITRMKGASASI